MIKVLDKKTIDKIAAGEVIERPYSIVKELLDNSIDAEATAITVEIKDGGMSFIRVTDNGVGIKKDEVKTAYLSHATSKLSNAEGLSCINTLGFRGEALSTIAAISQTEMITKTADSLTGVRYVIHGGEEIEFKEVGVPNGTTIVARNIFYNTPARKKFLKSAMTEASYISDLVQKIALSHPAISFKLIINNQTKIDTSGNGNIRDTIYELFGRDITAHILPISYEMGDIKINGFIGKPLIARGNRALEHYFINGRYIKNNIINRAIEEGYKTFVMQHKFPFTVLYISLPPNRIDVNVHPTKMEFKFDDEKLLFEAVTKAVRDTLNHREFIIEDKAKEEKKVEQKMPVEKPAEPFETARKQNVVMNKVASAYSPSYKVLEALSKDENKSGNAALNLVKDNDVIYETSKNPLTPAADIKTNTEQAVNKPPQNEIKRPETVREAKINAYKQSGVISEKNNENVQTSMFDDDFLTENARKKHRIIGQVFGTYWLIEYEDKLYIMDQHAAHEKVKYEGLIKNLKMDNADSQLLMPPMVITVSYVEKIAILNNFDLFIKIGYDIEEFGGNEFKINAVPLNLFGINEREVFLSFVASLVDNSGYMSNDVFIKKLSTMACKAAIKGNSRITTPEADALVDELLKLDNPYTCPHGRPTIISISETELEKKFKRQL